MRDCCNDSDLDRLEEAMKVYKDYSHGPDEDYHRAVRTLEYLKLKKGRTAQNSKLRKSRR